MSVLAQLQQHAGEGLESFSGPEFSGSQDMLEAEEMFQAQAIPGQSLTQDPQSRMPYEQPPQFSDLQEFIEETFLKISDPEGLPDLFDVMRTGIPIETIAQKILMRSFQNGEISPDLLLQAIEPVIYMLISLATYGDVDAELYPEDPMIDEEDEGTETAAVFRQASLEMMNGSTDEDDDGKITVDEVQAPSTMPRSLLARSKEAVGKIAEAQSE